MSRDCLLQVTLASAKWINHINFGNGFDFLNIFSDHNLHMLLVKLYAAAANQNHTHDSEGDPSQPSSCYEGAVSKEISEGCLLTIIFDFEGASLENDSDFDKGISYKTTQSYYSSIVYSNTGLCQ